MKESVNVETPIDIVLLAIHIFNYKGYNNISISNSYFKNKDSKKNNQNVYINSEIQVKGINNITIEHNEFKSEKTDLNVYIKATKPIYKNNNKIPKNTEKYSAIHITNKTKNKQTVKIT
jgi:hypothetical protein